MDFFESSKKYLYNETIGQMPVNEDGVSIPALLFANSKNDEYFGDLYLFSNFGISGGNTITASSELSNNYMENNSQRQDHWAITPIAYTLTGYVGEVIYRPASNWSNWLGDNVMNYLLPLSVISPVVSGYVQSAMNIVHQLEANYQRYSKYAENFIRNFQGNGNVKEGNQYIIFQNLLKLRDQRILVDVYTPYGVLKDMAMTTISMSEDEKSKYKYSINITLQEYKEISTYTREATEQEKNKLIQSEVLSQQASSEKNNGIATSSKTQLADIVNPDNKLKAKFYKG